MGMYYERCRQVPLLVKEIPMEEIIEKLCKEHGTLIQVKKNTVLFRADFKMETPYVYYVVEGICALSGNSYHGKEQVLLYFYAYNKPIGITKTECTLYRIPISVVLELLETNLEFNKYIINTLSRHYHLTLAHLKQVQEDSSITVVCRFLLSMSEDKDEGFVLPRFFTYEEIARYLGVHSVTVGKIIAKLQRLGYIKRISSGILIENEEALKELVVNCEAFKY